MIMNKEKVKELLKKRSTKIGGIVLAAAIVFSGSMWAWQDSRKAAVPELVTFVDQAEDMVIEEEEPPLAAPKVTKSTKTQTKKKKIKMKKPATKTYVQKGKSSTKKTTKVSKKGSTTTTTETVKATDIQNQFKKGSNIKTQVTTIKTTVTKTVQTQEAAASAVQTTAAAAAPAAANGPANIASLAPRVDSRVMNAFNKLGFTININSGVNYSGLFDARTRSITLKNGDATVYHELGHFLGFIAGNYDKTAEFQAIFNKEKALYTAYNKAYVLSNSSEYFAESFKNYTEDPGSLRASRPETCAAIETALSRVTDGQLNNIMSVYKVIWG